MVYATAVSAAAVLAPLLLAVLPVHAYRCGLCDSS